MIYFILFFVVAIMFGVVGASMAKSRNRDGAVWFIICFLFPLIGLLALAVGGEKSNDHNSTSGEKGKQRVKSSQGKKPSPALNEDEIEAERIRWLISQGIDPNK